MNILTIKEAIEQKRSIKKLKTDPVPDEYMTILLDATRLAPPGCKLSKFLCCLAFFVSLTFVVFICGCKSKESYRKELERKGIPYSVESFLGRVGVGNKEIIELFFKAGMNVNAKGNNGETALIQAAVNHNIEMLKMLIKKGADVNAKNNRGDTALKYAFLNTQIEELLRKAGAKQQNFHS